MRKIFVKISMSQGNLDEVEACEIEPSITEEADEEWINGSKVFQVELKKGQNMEKKLKEFKVYVEPIYKEKIYKIKAVDEDEAEAKAIRLHEQRRWEAYTAVDIKEDEEEKEKA